MLPNRQKNVREAAVEATVVVLDLTMKSLLVTGVVVLHCPHLSQGGRGSAVTMMAPVEDLGLTMELDLTADHALSATVLKGKLASQSPMTTGALIDLPVRKCQM